MTDYRARRHELESKNPFAVVAEAHLMTQDSRRDPYRRIDFKVELTRSLYRRGFSQETIVKLFSQKEEGMPYISSIERRSHEQGLKEGLEQGLEQGLKDGLVLFPEPLRNGRPATLEQGLKDGLEQGLTEAIQAILAGRFGKVPFTVNESLAGLDASRLKQLSLLAATADSLEAFRSALE